MKGWSTHSEQNKVLYLQSTKHQFGDKLVVEPLFLLSFSSKSCLKKSKVDFYSPCITFNDNFEFLSASNDKSTLNGS